MKYIFLTLATISFSAHAMESNETIVTNPDSIIAEFQRDREVTTVIKYLSTGKFEASSLDRTPSKTGTIKSIKPDLVIVNRLKRKIAEREDDERKKLRRSHSFTILSVSPVPEDSGK